MLVTLPDGAKTTADGFEQYHRGLGGTEDARVLSGNVLSVLTGQAIGPLGTATIMVLLS